MKILRKIISSALPKVSTRSFSDLLTAIAASGLRLPSKIDADAGLKRLSSSGRRNDKSGWGIAQSLPVQHAAFGCWRSGINATWSSITDDLHNDQQRAQL
jgi:hypothetical protein